MFNDPYWGRFDFRTDYPFEVLVFNVTTLLDGFHPSEFKQPVRRPLPLRPRATASRSSSLDDYLAVLDRLFREAKAKGAVCLKTTLAYERTLDFDERPEGAGRARPSASRGRELTAAGGEGLRGLHHVAARRAERQARPAVPDPHRRTARIQGSNPMLLVDLIEANPKTKFILFHGGYPWVGETGAIVHAARPARLGRFGLAADDQLHDGQAGVPRMAGGDAVGPDHVGGRLQPRRGDLRRDRVSTRRCLAEVLAEKVDRGDLTEEHAARIGRQILRDNALALFPQLKGRLWKGKGKLPPEKSPGAGDGKP